MKRVVINLLFLLFSNAAVGDQPLYSINALGAVTSLIIEGELLYVATDMGCIQIFNWKSKQKLKIINLEPIKDFMGDDIPPKVYSIDKISDQTQILILSQGKDGYSNLCIFEEEKMNKVIDAERHKMMIKKACFLDEDHLIFATLGNEIMLFNIPSKTYSYQRHIGSSVFSDFCLNEDKSQIAATDESGVIRVFSSKSGKSIKELKGQNVDNIYQLAFHSGKVIGAGQDRRVCVYGESSAYHLESSFLVYSVGLSNDGIWGAYAYGEENHIKVFNTSTKKEKCILKGQKSTLTQIKFADDQYIISASEDPEIMVWKWK